MKYTKGQLQGMSDLALMRTLFELLGFEVHDYEFQGVITIQKGSKVTTAELTPDDIMPLAFEHDISLIKEAGCTEWGAFKGLYVYYEEWSWDAEYSDKNPLRAIACCLILALQMKRTKLIKVDEQ